MKASGAGLLGDAAVQDHHHPLPGLQDEAGLRHEERGGEVVARAKMPLWLSTPGQDWVSQYGAIGVWNLQKWNATINRVGSNCQAYW